MFVTRRDRIVVNYIALIYSFVCKKDMNFHHSYLMKNVREIYNP